MILLYLFAAILLLAIFTSPIWITLIVVFCSKKGQNNENINNQIEQTNNEENKVNNQYILNNYLLTNKEELFYNSLKPITDKYNYIIFCKMRLADIVSVNAKNNEFMALFNKINKKHIDFVICNINFIPLLLIEVDDYTHNRRDRAERDKFVDSIFQGQGIQILHIRRWDSNLENIIIEAITKRKIKQTTDIMNEFQENENKIDK